MAQFFILIDEQRRQNAVNFIQSLGLKRTYSVEIKEYRKNRSNAQNRLYWSWLHIIADTTDNDANDLHEMFKGRLLGVTEKMVLGRMAIIPRSTATLNTKQFTEYLEAIELVANQMELRLPHPDDYAYIMGHEDKPAGRVASQMAG